MIYNVSDIYNVSEKTFADVYHMWETFKREMQSLTYSPFRNITDSGIQSYDDNYALFSTFADMIGAYYGGTQNLYHGRKISDTTYEDAFGRQYQVVFTDYIGGQVVMTDWLSKIFKRVELYHTCNTHTFEKQFAPEDAETKIADIL